MDYVFILAGGSGTRLWPASLKQRPKQFIKLVKGESLFQQSLKRAAAVKPASGIIVIALREQYDLIKDDIENCAEINVPVSILSEPCGRNTAPAISAAVLYANSQLKKGAEVLVLASDHLISPLGTFVNDVKITERIIRDNCIATFGIKPSGPDTGFGYIEAGEKLEDGFVASNFKEKPDGNTAREYCDKGNYYWNSGMFAFNGNVFLKELKKYCPEILDAFGDFDFGGPAQASGKLSKILDNAEFAECYRNMPSISVDYAVMERSEAAAVLPASFEWSDLGSWDRIFEIIGGDIGDTNILPGPDSGGNYVFSDMPVALPGINDLIVVIKNGKCLICKKGGSSLVKNVVEELKKNGLSEHL